MSITIDIDRDGTLIPIYDEISTKWELKKFPKYSQNFLNIITKSARQILYSRWENMKVLSLKYLMKQRSQLSSLSF